MPTASTPHAAVAAALSLAPQIQASRDELEATHRLPPALVEALRQAGLFQMYLPQAMGGPELEPLTVFQAIEALSRVDGSVGWCSMIAVAESLFVGWLQPEVGYTLFGQPPDARMAGSLRPEGKAYVVEGGYRVHGRWDFASGINHANWLMCTCHVMDGDSPQRTPGGLPLTRILLVPVTAARIIDTWSVVGMCGTGSQDFVVEDVFVPAAHTFSLAEPPAASGPLYHQRLLFVVAWTPTVANALGMARGALDTFTRLAQQAHSTSSTTLLRDRPQVQTQVAEAEAIVNAARAYVLSAVSTAWEAVCSGVPDPGPAIAQARLAITHGMHEAVRAVDLVFHAAGTNAVYRKHGLERYFRDVHTAVQHAAGLHINIETAGKVLLGLQPHDLGW
jgi:alkylation response protein AidB-like acyl-CoA dehydrogenase